MKNHWWIVGLIAFFGLIITVLVFLYVADKREQERCVEDGGRVVKTRGLAARGEWFCDH